MERSRDGERLFGGVTSEPSPTGASDHSSRVAHFLTDFKRVEEHLCPHCLALMVKAGFNYRRKGPKQQWKCTNKMCALVTVNPEVSYAKV